MYIKETSSRKIIINSLNNFDKKQFLISILVIKELLLKTQNINMAKIGENIYCTASYLKKSQVFAILIKDIQY